MSQSKKRIKVKGGANKASTVQGAKHTKEALKELYFAELRLYIQQDTFETLHKVKQVSGVDVGRAISFLLDAGTVLYSAMEEKMIENLKKVKKK